MIADGLGLVSQIVGIHTDAVSAHQARLEGQEIPLAARRREYFLGVDLQAVEDEGELVDEGDVDVALGVLDDLGRLGDPDAAGLMGAGGDDAAVEVVDEVGDLGGGTRGYLLDVGQPVFFRLVPVDNSLIFINFMNRLRAKRTDSLTNRFFLLSIRPV